MCDQNATNGSQHVTVLRQMRGVRLAAQWALVALVAGPACEPKGSTEALRATTRQAAVPALIPAPTRATGGAAGSLAAAGGSAASSRGGAGPGAPPPREDECDNSLVKPGAAPTRFAVI